VEAAEEAHLKHEFDADLQVKKDKETLRTCSRLKDTKDP